jgi:hypothetical protein
MISSWQESLSAVGGYQKDIPTLEELGEYRYENFFRIYVTENKQYFYNLQSFSVYFLEELDPSTYYDITITKALPWTAISYNEYRTMDLWWLIMVINQIYNPLKFPKAGTTLKILLPQYIKIVMNKLKDEIK